MTKSDVIGAIRGKEEVTLLFTSCPCEPEIYVVLFEKDNDSVYWAEEKALLTCVEEMICAF